MENINIYESIAERTQGNIYIGVVGPVRTGKSTFIKRFMDLLVLPNVSNTYVRQRVQDELPQSGAGKTITTTEPKFIPAEAVNIELPGNVNFRVRMADCVGYLIPGVLGHMEDGKARMVATPWEAAKIPFEEAAETGTRKVIRAHSTIGVLLTTDGSIGDIGREAYVAAEGRVASELRELGKPFVVVLNSLEPESEKVRGLAAELCKSYKTPVVACNCAKMNVSTLREILVDALYQFPASEIRFHFPGFVEGLDRQHWIKSSLISSIRTWSQTFENIEDMKKSVTSLADGEVIKSISIDEMDLSKGNVDVRVEMADGLFYKVVEELTEQEIKNDYEFFSLLKEFAEAKKSYDKLRGAMYQVENTGYGIVQPKLSEMVLGEPEVFRQGSKYGVRLTAKAPSLHIIKTNITTEVSPVVGTEKQSEDLVRHLLTEFEQEPSKIWDTNIFGKSLYEMVTEQMENKLSNVPEHIRAKVQRSLQKISDEGKEYFICIVI